MPSLNEPNDKPKPEMARVPVDKVRLGGNRGEIGGK